MEDEAEIVAEPEAPAAEAEIVAEPEAPAAIAPVTAPAVSPAQGASDVSTSAQDAFDKAETGLKSSVRLANSKRAEADKAEKDAETAGTELRDAAISLATGPPCKSVCDCSASRGTDHAVQSAGCGGCAD